MMDGRQVRVSTKKRILQDAKDAAREIYLDYRFRQKNGLPVISKRFADVAALFLKEPRAHGVCFFHALPVAICIPFLTWLCNCMFSSFECCF
jgi:hypothetical protein